MASLQNFYTSRDNNANADSYVGQLDRLWYNPNLNSIYVSDGNTPGGIPVGLATAANAIFTNITVNGAVLGNLNITGNISPAAMGKIGGIQPGPGVEISNIGLLTIDSANLPVSFGNFYANNNILSIVNADENMIIETQGNAEIQLVGNIGFYGSDGSNPGGQYFYASKDGQLTIYVPVIDPVAGAVKIIGSGSGNSTAPVNTGVMLQITGQNNDASRIYNDSIGGFAALVGRRLNGNVNSPTPVLANEEIMRLTATSHNGTAFPTAAGQRITYRALGNQSLTNGGGAIEFWTTPLNSTTIGQVAIIDSANGITATKFATSGNISATGNITGGNISATNGTFTKFTGKYIRNYRNAGVIADGGTLTIDFATDAVVRCEWGNGFTLAYTNYTTGSVVKVLAYKTSGTGTDNLSLGGLTPGYVSTGSTTVAGTAGTTTFIELTCTNTDIGNVFAKL